MKQRAALTLTRRSARLPAACLTQWAWYLTIEAGSSPRRETARPGHARPGSRSLGLGSWSGKRSRKSPKHIGSRVLPKKVTASSSPAVTNKHYTAPAQTPCSKPSGTAGYVLSQTQWRCESLASMRKSSSSVNLHFLLLPSRS